MRYASEHGMAHSELLSWSVEDRSKLMAFLLEDAARCSSCGTSPWEWEEDPYAYEPASMTCLGCRVKEIANDDAASAPGARIALLPKEVARAMREAPKKAPTRRRKVDAS